MFLMFSNRIGCGASVLISLLISLVLLFAMGFLRF